MFLRLNHTFTPQAENIYDDSAPRQHFRFVFYSTECYADITAGHAEV